MTSDTVLVPTGEGASPALPGAVTSGDLRRAAWAASLGSALEYYDFALYNLAAALVFGPLFFPSANPALGVIASFATFFVGFAARPFGGIIFGILGDRYGRKFVLIATLLLMGTSSTLIGVLPTYATAGIWAPIMLVFLRVMQGLGAGAEQAGAAILMAEYAPPARRGYYAALPLGGVMLGSAGAATIYLLVLAGIDDPANSDVWRFPFLFSVVIIATAFWVRLRLKESPSFARLEARQQVDQRPLRNLLAGSRRPVLTVIGLRIGEGSASAIYQSLAISYMVTVTGLGARTGIFALLASSTTGALMTWFAGRLSDRFGRVPMYRLYAVAQLAFAFPVWWALSQGNQALSIAALSIALLPVWGMLGTQGALFPELFGARHRYVGVAMGREIAAMTAGGLSPLIGAFIIAYMAGRGDAGLAWIPLAAYVVAATFVTLATTLVTPETRGRDLDALGDAPRRAGSAGDLAGSPGL